MNPFKQSDCTVHSRESPRSFCCSCTKRELDNVALLRSGHPITRRLCRLRGYSGSTFSQDWLVFSRSVFLPPNTAAWIVIALSNSLEEVSYLTEQRQRSILRRGKMFLTKENGASSFLIISQLNLFSLRSERKSGYRHWSMNSWRISQSLCSWIMPFVLSVYLFL
jgi:hypothetical protein